MRHDKSLLCFFPEADLLNWYSLELVTAQAARKSFPEVQILGCSRDMQPLCAVMSASALDISASARERDRACRSCIRTKRSAQRQLDLTWFEMALFERDEDKDIAQGVCSDVTPANYLDVEFEGIPVGRYAAYLPHLASKGAQLAQDWLLWKYFTAELELVIKTILMSARAVEALSPSAVLTSNHLYGAHRAFLTVARRQGVRTWGMASGGLLPGRSESVGLFPEEVSGQTISLSMAAEQSMQSPLSDLELSLLTEHMRALRQGNDPWVYSSSISGLGPEKLREFLGARPNSPVVTVLLASPDEMESAVVAKAEFRAREYVGLLSPQQFLEGALECARQLPEVDFVVRIHPRMVANKRESAISPHMAPLMERLSTAPRNVLICHPDMKVSLYDNILISDAAMNYTSSSGLEFMSFGLPVVHADDLRLGIYPASLGVAAKGVADLPRAVFAALESGWNIANVERALRWWATVHIRIALFPFLDEHTVDGFKDLASGKTQEKAKQDGRSLRSFVPASLKRRLAGLDKWRSRRGFQFPSASPLMAMDLEEALSTRQSGPIWEPPLFFRRRGLLDSQLTAFQALNTAISDLGWDRNYLSTAPGLGGIRRYLGTLEQVSE